MGVLLLGEKGDCCTCNALGLALIRFLVVQELLYSFIAVRYLILDLSFLSCQSFFLCLFLKFCCLFLLLDLHHLLVRGHDDGQEQVKQKESSNEDEKVKVDC